MITIYFDGACELFNGKRNPGGLATYGWYIEQDGQRLAWGYGEAGRGEPTTTNNLAEYTALIQALEAALSLGIPGPQVTVKGDSQLVIYQLIGNYKVKSPALIPLYQQAKELLDAVGIIRLEWVPREQNQAADDLSKAAYKKSLNLQNQWHERYRIGGFNAASCSTLS